MDNALSPILAERLRQAGHEAAHATFLHPYELISGKIGSDPISLYFSLTEKSALTQFLSDVGIPRHRVFWRERRHARRQKSVVRLFPGLLERMFDGFIRP